MSAYQFGCEALIALGRATPAIGGARPKDKPTPPATLPRWDDVCCAVLALSDQNGLLRYLGQEDEARLAKFFRPRPTVIQASHGLGRVVATRDVVLVLRSLGLIEGDRWTPVAELVFWREQPRQWRMDIVSDPRFAAAVTVAAQTMPSDIRERFDRLTTISDAEVGEWLEQDEARRSSHPTGTRPLDAGPPPSGPAEARDRIAFQRRNELDWLFFRRWRLEQGWLSLDQAACALAIFHDRLAIAVRRGVVSRLRPNELALQK